MRLHTLTYVYDLVCFDVYVCLRWAVMLYVCCRCMDACVLRRAVTRVCCY